LTDALRRPEIEPAALASFRRERAADATLPLCMALMEGGFVGVIADKVYHAHPAWIAFATAAPMFANLSSVWWARLAERVPPVPMLVALQGSLVACVAAVALLPRSPLGLALLMALLVAARLAIGAVVTVRSVVWTHNYPRAVRARVTARLAILSQARWPMGVLAGPRSTAGGDAATVRARRALGVLGAWSRGVRVQGNDAAAGAEPAPPPPRTSTWRVLREDPPFARYLGWQFLLGVSNMMIEPAVVYAVSREMGAGYGTSIAIVTVVPNVLSMATLPLWARWVDHAAEFRAKQWLWVLSQGVMGVGTLTGSVFWIGFGRVVFGVARGGGNLAWSLGHNDFAHPERAGLYMGVHATLTGMRGVFAPFVGMLLYLGAAPRELPFGLSLPAVPALGGWMMVLAAGLALVATLGFARLQREIERERAASRVRPPARAPRRSRRPAEVAVLALGDALERLLVEDDDLAVPHRGHAFLLPALHLLVDALARGRNQVTELRLTQALLDVQAVRRLAAPARGHRTDT
jgi:MFS family permease